MKIQNSPRQDAPRPEVAAPVDNPNQDSDLGALSTDT